MAKAVLITGAWSGFGKDAALFCFSGFGVEHFSKERAFVYAEPIERKLKKPAAPL
jgi:NADP-dependent 3-hydroxy acid dehydrogenase YdfG